MRNVSFLLSIEKLNRASIEDYKERFGNPVHVVNGKEALMDVHPEISEMLDGLLSTGWSAYFFFIKTIPHRYLIVVCDEDGNVVLRTWEYM